VAVRLRSISLAIVATLSTFAVGRSLPAAEPAPMSLGSSEFANGSALPSEFSCDGPGGSPQLGWSNPPAGTQSFALVVRDLDTPQASFVHWIVYDIPLSASEMPQSSAGARPAADAAVGTNSRGEIGWTPPCPPAGRHRYRFELYALDSKLAGLSAPTAPALMAAMRGHILARADIVGSYERSR
jgi:Raf kinase inhibitor-like YbhB/YbcL family protein